MSEKIEIVSGILPSQMVGTTELNWISTEIHIAKDCDITNFNLMEITEEASKVSQFFEVYRKTDEEGDTLIASFNFFKKEGWSPSDKPPLSTSQKMDKFLQGFRFLNGFLGVKK